MSSYLMQQVASQNGDDTTSSSSSYTSSLLQQQLGASQNHNITSSSFSGSSSTSSKKACQQSLLKRKLPSTTTTTYAIRKKQRGTLPFGVDLWIYIVSAMLPISSLLRFSQTCTSLMTVLARVIRTREIKVKRCVRQIMEWPLLSEVRHLSLINCTRLDALLPMLPKLESLSICFYDDNVQAQIGAGTWGCLGGLRKLKLYGCGKTLDDVALGNLPSKKLESLTIEMCESSITDEGMSQLQRMHWLKEFKVSCIHDLYTDITDAGWECLKGMYNVTILALSEPTDIVLGYIVTCMKKLEELDLEACGSITQDGWKLLGKSGLPLKKVSLISANITDLDLISWLEGLHTLTELNLEDCNTITGEEFGHTFRSSKLEILKLRCCNNIQTGVTDFLPVTLKVLDLLGCTMITDEDLVPLQKIPLETLYLQDCKQITDQGVASLPTSLVELDLSDISNITEKCIPFLLEMKNLQSLDIRDTRVPAMPIAKCFKGKLRYTR